MTFALLQLALLSMLLFGIVGSLFVALTYPHLRCRVAAMEAATRARMTLTWIAFPALLAAALTGVSLLPSVAMLAGHDVGDHCLTHGDHHAHLCLVHQPDGLGTSLGWCVVALVGLWTLGFLVRAGRSLRAAYRSVAPLIEQSTADPRLGIGWVPSALPVALTVGLLRPRILVSDTLRDALSPKLLDAVIAHERAHERRRDVVKRTLTVILVRFHVPWLREVLLDDFVLATELAADAAAAEAVGSTLRVADAILAVERLAADAPRSGVALAFGEATVGSRIEALLSPARRPDKRLRFVWIAAVAGLLLALALPAHHAAETIATVVAG